MAPKDELTEFDDVDPFEIHLVSTPANNFAPLLAKSAKKGRNMKPKKQLRKLAKGTSVPPIPSVNFPVTRGVDLSGGASTISRFLRAFQERVEQAETRLSATKASTVAGSMAADRAKASLREALYRRFLAKSVVRENARRRGYRDDGLIPGATSVFKDGSTYSLGDDESLRYR